MIKNSLFRRVTVAAEERQLLQNALTAYQVSQGDCSGDRRMLPSKSCSCDTVE